MSRSASDATRFTATPPHAYSKPSSLRAASVNTFSPSSAPRSHNQPRNVSKATPPQSSGVPPETPAQKVARLRAQHEAAKLGEITRWEKIVIRGRVWADRAHRITAYSLMGFSVFAGAVTLFSLGDMIIYNRRKRNAFYAEQRILLQRSLAEAREAAANGIANEDQILLLNRERAADEADAARKARKGPTDYLKALFSTEGLKSEETDSTLNVLGEEGLQKMEEEVSSDNVPITMVYQTTKHDGDSQSDQSIILKMVNDQRRESEKELEKRGIEGGPLDEIAEHTMESTKSKDGRSSWNPWR